MPVYNYPDRQQNNIYSQTNNQHGTLKKSSSWLQLQLKQKKKVISIMELGLNGNLSISHI